MVCTQVVTNGPPHVALQSTHPSNSHSVDQQGQLQQALLSHQPAGASFVAQPGTAQQYLQHLQAAQQHAINPHLHANPLINWQQLLQQQQQQQHQQQHEHYQQLLALFAAQQATPPSFQTYVPAMQPGSYAQPGHNALYPAYPAQQTGVLARQWQQALAQLRAPAVTPLQYAYPPRVAPVLGAENGSVLPNPAPVEAARQLPPTARLPPGSFPNADTEQARYLAPAAPAEVPSYLQTGQQMHQAPAADAAQQQAAVPAPVQGHADQQPNFFAALWDGMRSAGAAVLRRQPPPRAAAAPLPDPQVPQLLYPELCVKYFSGGS